MIKKAKKYLVPHKENDYKPHLFSPKGFGMVSVVIMVLFMGSILQFQVLSSTGWLSAILPGVLTDYTNQSRVQASLPTLRFNETLRQAAQLKANDMAAKGYFSHNSPDGKTPWYWFREAGYKFIYAGENLAVNFVDSGPVHSAWMNSPGHRENILSGNFTEIGIALAEGKYEGRDTIFVVQMFGQPVPTFDIAQNQTSDPEVNNTEEIVVNTGNDEDNEDNQASTNEQTESEVVLEEQQRVVEETTRFISVRALDQSGEPFPLIPLTQGRDTVDDSSLSADGEFLGDSAYSSWIAKVLSSPQKTLSVAYLIIAAIISIVLIATIFSEVKKHHTMHIASGILLLLFIVIFFYLSREFVFNSILIV